MGVDILGVVFEMCPKGFGSRAETGTSMLTDEVRNFFFKLLDGSILVGIPMEKFTVLVAVWTSEHQANNPIWIAINSLAGYISLRGFGA